jgi:hypothetical protein
VSQLVYTRGPNAGMTLGQVSDPRMEAMIKMRSPRTADAMKMGSKFKAAVLSKWDYYQKNYGYKKTKASAKAASIVISDDLSKSFPDKLGTIRINDPEAVYEIIEPFEIKLPWWLDWKLIVAGAAVVYFGPGIIGRYRKGAR